MQILLRESRKRFLQRLFEPVSLYGGPLPCNQSAEPIRLILSDRNKQALNHHSIKTKIQTQNTKQNYQEDKIMNNVQEPSANLMAHCGTRKITRDELREIPLPEATATHQPLSHYELIETLVETLSYRYLKVRRDEYAVSSDGMKLFGVMDLEYGFTGCNYSIGLRNSNDKSMRLALTAGYRVFVCDNMMFSGDFQPLLHKHTKNLNLSDALSIAVDRIHRNFEPMKEKVILWQETELSDEIAKLLIYEAFLDKKLKVPRSLLPVVHDYYFKPDHEAFKARNLWSLSNAFTSAFKKLKPIQQFSATAKLGEYLEPISNKIEESKILPFPVRKSILNGIEKDSEIEDLTVEYDADEFADAFENYDQSIESELLGDYENSDFDYEEDELTEEFMLKAA